MAPVKQDPGAGGTARGARITSSDEFHNSGSQGEGKLGGSGDTNTGNTCVDFLRDFLGEDAPWPLVAIKKADGKNDVKAATSSAAPKREAGVASWVRRWNDKGYDVYFAINPLRMPLNRKASKADVAAAAWLWIDLDPRKDADPAAEQAALDRALAADCPAEIPVPTWEIDSGRGRWGFWRLGKPVPVDGKDGTATRRAEGHGRGIEQAFGKDFADNCRNIDRIARLPGTVNQKTGRRARVVAHRPEAVYDLQDFPFVDAEINGHDTAATAGASIDLDNLPSVDIDALPVSARIRHMIRTGEDPGGKLKDTSRSGAFWTVLLAMVGAGCDDATMATVMFDEALPIGAHVRDQRNPAEKLEEQIAKARDRASDPAVAELNETYALVIVGNQAAVLEERADGTFRLLSTSTFEEWLKGRWVRVGKRTVALAKHWREHPRRRRYSDIVFSPGGDAPGAYNLWRGFKVEPRPGDCSRFLEHLRSNICCGNEAHYRWVVGWFADIVQNPAEKCGTALVMRGKMGTGKTKVGEVIGSILGRHYTIVADPRYITGRFNSHLVDCLLLHADEGFWAGDRAAEGKLKDLITGHEHLVEFKGKEPFRVRNHVRLLVGSNADWVVPAGLEERRFAVFDVGEDHMQDGAYFAAIDEEMNNGGREALLHHLLNFDLSTVDLRVIPKTAGLAEQKVSSLTHEYAWWQDTLSRGELPWGCDAPGECPTNRLFDCYIKHAKRQGAPRRAIETKIGMFLHKVAPGMVKDDGWYSCDGKTLVLGLTYRFPPLAECRAAWAKKMQARLTWHGAEEWRTEPRLEPDEGAF
jgi:Family of unknown function (DUF5906)